ncbi:MAG: GNAT family N-acetyltransferase [Anaerolineales bacterium]
MNLKRFQAAADFRAHAEAFLVEHEAEHNLPLGLTSALMVKPDLYPSQPYFAVVEAGGAIVAAAMMTPPYNLILSRTEAHGALALVAQDVRAVHPTLPGVVGPVIVNNILTTPPETRGIYFWEDPHPVSMAGYGGPTPNGIRVGPVYTPPEQRRKGYASACVAALSQLMLDRGRKYCFLFTDLANPTSNHIYQQIGYEPVCDVDEYKFD